MWEISKCFTPLIVITCAKLYGKKCQDYIYVNEGTKVLCKKNKHYLRHENKIKENNVLSYYD